MRPVFVVFKLLTAVTGLLLVFLICFETPKSPVAQTVSESSVQNVVRSKINRPTLAPPRIPCSLRGVGEVIQIRIEVGQSPDQL